MNKELNPDLFGERRTATARAPETNLSTPQDTGGFLNLDRQMLELKHGISTLGDELKRLAGQSAEFMKTSHLKLERLQQQVGRLEQSHNGMVQETGTKLSQIGMRFNERKSIDAKIQEMVDRHTNVIKSFEVRMNHLQRLLADKEAQIVSAQATLNEAKMEISRLKRM
jgi:chromosome segregation ATPase